MKISELILNLTLFSPYLYTLLYILSRFTHIDYFTLIGLLSLTALAISKYSSIILFSLMLVPSITCFGLFIVGYPLPLIGLAAGYMLSFPLFIILGTYYEAKSENIVLSYLTALVLNLFLIFSSVRDSLTPSTLIITIMLSIPTRILKGGTYHLPESVNSILTFLTAISCLALFLIIVRRVESNFPRNLKELNPLILSTLITFVLSLLTRYWIYSNLLVALSISIIIAYLIISLKIVK
ncbi:MAG: hypothetical protein ABDH32_01980 [Candidatus Caldarchaeales archaeon]